ncbi:hypothetical protein CFIO01_06162 [Colletotrichum fioriniae PJ7]|uniref:Uncharacterized protein n=1 Tax=Colletotrichum fioriniae PJ7 TaxID=1445577 RepID=A0A010RBT9_9PEZI|nr:hypothetical protein CFIO01_06162 [Colletotrichum fioriniae PJ7]
MVEPGDAVGALGPEPHEADSLTVEKSDGISQPGDLKDDQSSDSNSDSEDATDQLQSPLMQLLSTMASHPHPEAEADLNKLRELINTDKSQVNGNYGYSKTAPLHIAAERGLVDAVEEMLRAGAELGSRDRAGFTPLMIATEKRQADVMGKLLLPRSESADVKSQLEIRNRMGWTPLLLATIYRFSEGVKLLIDAGADCNAQTRFSYATPLVVASSLGYQEIAMMLLDTRNPKGCARLNLQDEDGNTALTSAVIEGHHGIAKSLLDADADFTIKNHQEKNALHLASEQGNERIVDMLLKADALKATVNETDEKKRTPLHLAINTLHKLQNKLSLDQIDSVDLMVEEDSNAEAQSHCIGTIQLLLDHRAQPEAETLEGETALHLAVACGESSVLRRIVEKVKPEHLSIRNRNQQTALSFVLQLEGRRRATAMRVFLNSDFVKIAKFDQENTWDRVLVWATNDYKLHDIAQQILHYKIRKKYTMPPEFEGWNAIRWAAHYQDPKILRQLISSSPETDEIQQALKSVQESTLKLVNEPSISSEAIAELPLMIWLLITASKQTDELTDCLGEILKALETRTSKEKSLRKRYGGNPRVKQNGNLNPDRGENRQGSTTGEISGTKKQRQGSKQEIFESEQLEKLKYIIRDPPFAKSWVHKEPLDYGLPQPTIVEARIEVLKSFDANIVQFSRADGVVRTIQTRGTVRDIIYEAGPTKLIQTATGMHQAVADLDGDEGKIEPDFTWVHLPATNDLVTRILKEEHCSTNRYYQVSSFFQDSWVEMPDKKTESRMMRPRSVFRQQKQTTDAKPDSSKRSQAPRIEITEEPSGKRQGQHGSLGEGQTKDGKIQKPITVEAGIEANEDEEDRTGKFEEANEQGRIQTLQFESDGHEKTDSGFVAASAIYMPYFCFSVNLDKVQEPFEPKKRFDDLLDGYPTESMTTSEKHKQAKYGGRESQPRSADEMSKSIVDYLIRSYERLTEIERLPNTSSNDAASSENQELAATRELSISQIYSSHMNRIGRDETTLYETSRDRRQNKQRDQERDLLQKLKLAFPKWKRDSETGSKRSPSASSDAGTTMEDAFEEAEKLYGDIKDVRDELNILKSVAQHQKTVQMGLENKEKLTADLSAAYVVNDIEQMEAVAQRIESAVNTTISLQQNEIANYQAKLAGDQGKILMIFTFATLLFVSPIHQGAVFARSTMVSVIIGLVAFFWENIKRSSMVRVFKAIVYFVCEKINESTMASIFKAFVCFFWGKIKEYGEKVWRKSRELKASASKCFRS